MDESLFKLKAGYIDLGCSIPKTVCPQMTSESYESNSENHLLSQQSQRDALRIWRTKRRER